MPEKTPNPEERLAALEKAIDLDRRLDLIEKKFGPTGNRGWIIAVTAIISAVLPVMTWVIYTPLSS